jgi:hypothetical protein
VDPHPPASGASGPGGDGGPGGVGGGGAAGPDGGRRRPSRRSPAVLPAAAVVIAVTAGLLATAHGGSRDVPGTRAVSVTASGVRTVDLQAVAGQLTIVGSAAPKGGRMTLTGNLDWKGHAPQATARRGAAGLLRLWYRCAAASPCTANWRLVVPRDTAVVLSQPAGHLVISGLAGPLQITAESADVSATGLRSGSVQAAITSGHLGATFAAPPRQLSLSLTAAQATVSLPGTVGYAVSDEVTSGYVHVGVPQAAGTQHTVTAQVASGELELLPT